jgi:hypothetical protein
MRKLPLLLMLLASAVCQAASSMKGQVVHLYDVVYGFSAEGVTNAPIVCSAPGTQLYVTDDDGTTLIVSVSRQGNLKYPLSAWCSNSYLSEGTLYSIPRTALANERYTSQSWVSGVLTVPFKIHLSDHSVTVGSTIGGYVGYQTSFFNEFAITPIVSGGLALVSSTPLGATSSQTGTGISAAMGLIGTAGNSNMQYGFVCGSDWLGKNSGYRYDGKLWIAAEIGFNFGL